MQMAQQLAARGGVAGRRGGGGGLQARELGTAQHARRRHEEHRALQALDDRAAGAVLALVLHLHMQARVGGRVLGSVIMSAGYLAVGEHCHILRFLA